MSGFASYRTDARALAFEALIRPPTLIRSADGNVVSIGQGDTLDHLFVIRTTAPAFADGGIFSTSVVFTGLENELGNGSGSVAAFLPVPEPASPAMFLMFAGAAAIKRRRFRERRFLARAGRAKGVGRASKGGRASFSENEA